MHGLVAELVGLKDPATATALEAVGGGKLMNVVVDGEATASRLLQHGKLTRRATLIPLDRIASRTIAPAVVRQAQAEVRWQCAV